MAEQTTVDPFAGEASPEVAPVRAGEDLDWPRIANYLRERLSKQAVDAAGPFEILQFPNGSANLTCLVRFGTTDH